MSVINFAGQTDGDQKVLLQTVRKSMSQSKSGKTLNLQLGQDDRPMVSFSNEAKQMLEAREAEKRARAKEMVDKLNEKARQMQEAARQIREADKARQKEALQQKIADTKQRLKALVEMMRSALLFGDKKAAAAIAKEAAKLAKELAVALKEYGSQDAGGDISMPEFNISEDPETSENAESIAGAKDVDSVENIDSDAAEQVAAAEAAIKTATGSEDDDAGRTTTENTKDALKELVSQKLQKTKEVKGGLGFEDDLKIIVVLLRSIASMARATAKQKNTMANNPPANSQSEKKTAEEIEKSAKDIEKAIKEIELAAGAISV
ncbi:MAG: hypothetical protein FWG02_00810 [Holophagaceae bacterium]|nr:hypothetical protein [Holophagaceae bacterium]